MTEMGAKGVAEDTRTRRTFSDRLALVLATWFGCGFSPVAPGTAGTLGAIPLYPVGARLGTGGVAGASPLAPGTAGTLGAIPLYLVVARLGTWAVAVATIALALVGVAASTRVANLRGLKDPQLVCIDEVAGVFVALTAAAPTFGQITAAV